MLVALMENTNCDSPESLARWKTVDLALFVRPDNQLDLNVPPRRREAKWVKQKANREGVRRGGRRSEAVLIHRFVFFRDEENRK